MKLLLISHGNLAFEFLESAKMIIGDLKDIKAVGLQPGDDLKVLESKIINAIKEAEDTGGELFVVSDLFFGTPFNTLVKLSREYKFNHITGVNLAILLEIINCRDKYDGAALREHIMSLAKETIVDVNSFLEKQNE